MVGHHDREGGGENGTSWNSAHPTKGCGQSDLEASGGAGLFYLLPQCQLGSIQHHPEEVAVPTSRRGYKSIEPSTGSNPAHPGGWRWLCLAFAVSGAAALVYEVVWTRLRTLLMGSTTAAAITGRSLCPRRCREACGRSRARRTRRSERHGADDLERKRRRLAGQKGGRPVPDPLLEHERVQHRNAEKTCLHPPTEVPESVLLRRGQQEDGARCSIDRQAVPRPRHQFRHPGDGGNVTPEPEQPEIEHAGDADQHREPCEMQCFDSGESRSHASLQRLGKGGTYAATRRRRRSSQNPCALMRPVHIRYAISRPVVMAPSHNASDSAASQRAAGLQGRRLLRRQLPHCQAS